MSTATENFVQPNVSPHTQVMVAPRPNAEAVPGWVLKVKNRTVCVLAVRSSSGGSGLMRYDTCFHKDDPMILDRPHLFEDEGIGVYWLADAEIERRNLLERLRVAEQKLADRVSSSEEDIMDRMEAIEGVLDRLIDKLAAIESKRTAKGKA